MRTLQVGEHATRHAQAIAEIGHIEKTAHALRYLDALGLVGNVIVRWNTLVHAGRD